VLFLATGVGVETPLLKYEALEAHGVPAGVILISAGVALGYFWKVSRTKIVVEKTHRDTSDGSSTTTREEITTNKTL